jgi:5'(3')-deoxyribonucleotidase
MKLVYIDLDDTIADFIGSPRFVSGFDEAFMHEPRFFLDLKPVRGALVAVRQIIRMGYDVQILSQPVAQSAHSYSEKVQWIGMHFPELVGKINLTQDKGLFKGEFLIDDNAEKWKDKFEKNGGTFLHFNHKMPEASWYIILKKLEEAK